jgi:hypothetical protein
MRNLEIELAARVGDRERQGVERDDGAGDAALADRRATIVVEVVEDEAVDRDGDGEQASILVA